MPANLPAEAKSKWRRVMEAKTPEEKLEALREFMSAIPKHKGTERLRMQVTRQMAALRREIELSKRKRAGRGERFFVEKEGDVQVVLLGFPNSGKTSLLRCLTGAPVSPTASPFSTRRPQPGILVWKGVYFQFVDTPSILEGAARGAYEGSRVLALARNADAVVLVLDATGDVSYQYKVLLRELEESRISIIKPRAVVEIEKRRSGGVVIQGRLEGATLQEVSSLLRSYGIYHAVVRIRGVASLDDVEEALFGSTYYRPAAVVVTKVDLAVHRISSLKEFAATLKGVPVLFYSEKHCSLFNRDRLAEYLFSELGLIRVYTRNPKTGEVEEKPVVVERGARVIDVARVIHSQLYKNFKYAKVWSSRFRFSPQRVGREFVVEDGDIVEIVTR